MGGKIHSLRKASTKDRLDPLCYIIRRQETFQKEDDDSTLRQFLEGLDKSRELQFVCKLGNVLASVLAGLLEIILEGIKHVLCFNIHFCISTIWVGAPFFSPYCVLCVHK